ncbi:MAG: O-antigen ligase family protein [Terriglobia bacterium]
MASIPQRPIPGSETHHGAITSHRLAIHAAIVLAGVACVSAVVLTVLPGWMTTWEGIFAAVVGIVFVGALALALFWRAPYMDLTASFFRAALVIWAFLLISGELFSRVRGTAESAVEGMFSSAAYGELGLWVLCFLLLLFFSLRSRGYLHRLSSGQYKWLSGFAVVCVLSSLYSPRPAFSLAWAFKLCLVIAVLAMCSLFIRNQRDVVAFLRVTVLACLFIIASEVCRAVVDPSVAFEKGRMGLSPDSLSVTAGIVLILCLTLRAFSRSVWPVIAGIAASVVMIVSAGKAGIIGGIVSAALFFLMKKKVGSALAMLAGLVVLGVSLVLISAPLKSYLAKYTKAGQASSLTGRTELWNAALPAIWERPIRGHGYMGSKFASLSLQRFGWEADHMHNAFLDVLYNNGLIGLVFILMMHIIIVINLLQVMRRPGAPPGLRELAVGLLAVYADLLINAFFDSIIGSRPETLFMLFLAVFAMSGILREGINQRVAWPAKPVRWGAVRQNTPIT